MPGRFSVLAVTAAAVSAAGASCLHPAPAGPVGGPSPESRRSQSSTKRLAVRDGGIYAGTRRQRRGPHCDLEQHGGRAALRRPPGATRTVRRWSSPTAGRRTPQLQAAVDRWARRLLGLGVRPGDHVGLSMTNCPEFIEIVYAIGSIGAVMVPFNPRYRSAELAYVVENSDVSVMVVGRPPGRRPRPARPVARGAARRHRARRHRAASSWPRRRCCGGSCRSRPARVTAWSTSTSSTRTPRRSSDAELYELYARPRVRDAAMILFTSGTTARPKGAVLSHEAMTRTAIALGPRAISADARGQDVGPAAAVPHVGDAPADGVGRQRHAVPVHAARRRRRGTADDPRGEGHRRASSPSPSWPWT